MTSERAETRTLNSSALNAKNLTELKDGGDRDLWTVGCISEQFDGVTKALSVLVALWVQLPRCGVVSVGTREPAKCSNADDDAGGFR